MFGAVAVWGLMRPGPNIVARFVASPRGSEPPFLTLEASDVAISPDGQRLAFVAGNTFERRLQLRSIDQLAPTTVATFGSPAASTNIFWVQFPFSRAQRASKCC